MPMPTTAPQWLLTDADADAGFSWQDDEHGRQSCGLQERRLRYVWPWW
jgi:hypothetical protein